MPNSWQYEVLLLEDSYNNRDSLTTLSDIDASQELFGESDSSRIY